MISPYRIKYAGIASNELNIPDLITCVAIDSDNGESSSFLNRESVASESYDGRYKRIHQMKYTEVFAPKITFMKSDFKDFSMEDVRAVMKWLTMKDTTALLEVFYDDSNVVSWASIGGFVELQTYKLANNRTIAITATWDSISPFAFSDLYAPTQNVATKINTIMHYWTSTTVSGATAPQYLFTNVREPKIGTEVYSVPRAITNTVIDAPMTFYGAISVVNDDGSYRVNDTVLRLTYNNTKTKRTYSNKITIDIDTDDNKPVYPRITINHGYSTTSTVVPHAVVPLLPHITFGGLVDMQNYVENTVYYNEVKNIYYWKTSEPVWRSEATKPNYEGWVIVEVTRAYTNEDTYASNTFYHYADGNMYYWIDPYNFHSSDKNPNLQTTSVKITNQHYDFFGQPSDPVVMIVKNNTPTEKIVMDGANKIVSTDRTGRIFGDDFVNWQWLELYDGKNEITIEGDCEVTLQYRTVIKCGEF